VWVVVYEEAGVGEPSHRVVEARPLGLKRGLNYDNIAELLAQTEQEDFR